MEIEYVEWGIRRGLAVDDFAPALSFFLNAHNDFFEEIAKLSRRAPHLVQNSMTERFGAKSARSLGSPFPRADGRLLAHRTQQPYNNVVRTAVQALAAVMGGAQSLHTNSLDEAWALPKPNLAATARAANTTDPGGMKPASRIPLILSAAPISWRR